MSKTAAELAKEQREISISEFFEKNKHLLGFDNPTKALLMSVKEGVDNSLDAAEEAGILPDVTVKIKNVKEDRFQVMIQDNGPGIVKEQVPRVFGKLLYGSKFHRLKQNRGQQGLGISCSVLYSQLTTGSPTRIWSKTDDKNRTHYYELNINTMKNEPDILKEEDIENGLKEHGVKIEMEIVGKYRKTVEDYLKQTSIANPFAKIVYSAPDGTKVIFPRSVDTLPKPAKEMKPHPYGMEFGILLRLLSRTKSKTLISFLTNEFSSVGSQSARMICKTARLNGSTKPTDLTRDDIDKLLIAMQKVKVQRPPFDCLSPIGNKELERSLKKEYPEAEFVTAITREPEVYRGFPFIIECAIVYGTQTEKMEVIRFANRVPLIFQAGACATTEAIRDIEWKRYGLQQSGNEVLGPILLVIHMCSIWVPFISESKEAIASYPEIVKEMKLAIQDAARNLSRFLSGKRRAGEQKRRLQLFERYAPEVASALSKLTGRNEKELEKKIKDLVSNRIKISDDENDEKSG
jgi:DNA topoisomerase-6 subunit B